jgi:hypothetical protein
MWPVAARDERFRSSLRSDCYSPENQLRKISAYPHKSSDENTLIGRCVECPGNVKLIFFKQLWSADLAGVHAFYVVADSPNAIGEMSMSSPSGFKSDLACGMKN